MKKLSVLVAAVASALLLASCGSTEKVSELKVDENEVVVVDHKGKGFGMQAQPEWVMNVMAKQTNQKGLAKALGIEDSKIWVVYGSGPDLTFLRTWIDQVDARAEIAASIQQTIMDVTDAAYSGKKDGNSTENEQAVQRISERASNVTVSGLEKDQDWWTKTRQLKAGGNKKDPKDYIEEYNYLVVYSMSMTAFEKQMKDSLDTVLDGVGTEMSSEIRQMVMDKMYANSGVTPRKADAPASTSSTGNTTGEMVVYAE